MSIEELRALQTILRAGKTLPLAPIEEDRRNFELIRSAMPASPDILFEPSALGPLGGAWLRPKGVSAGRTLLFLHGGSFAIGSPATHRPLAGELAKAAGAHCFSLDYRLAPEHPFPAGLTDAVDAYRLLLDGAASSSAIAVAGDSAGGGLILSALIAIRDAGLPLPAGALLVSPWVDLTLSGPSMRSKAEADPRITEPMLRHFAAAYLGTMPSRTPLASPLFADLSGLPPMLIQVGSDEILLDDATRLAAAAGAAGVKTRLDIWPEMFHCWPSYASMLSEGQEAINDAGDFLRGLFDRT